MLNLWKVRDPEIEDELAFHAIPPITSRNLVYGGPIHLKSVLKDNATTAQDLTLGAVQTDPILDMAKFTGDNPKIVQLVTGVSMEFAFTADTDNSMRDLLQNWYIRFQTENNYEDRISCFDMGSSFADNFAVAETNATTKDLNFARHREMVTLRHPMRVRWEIDTVELACLAAVNVAADVPVTIMVHGPFWASSYDGFEPKGCTPGAMQLVPRIHAEALHMGILHHLTGAGVGAASRAIESIHTMFGQNRKQRQ